MFCVNCGERLPAGSRFCTNCGAVIREEPGRKPRRGGGGRKALIAVVIALAVLVVALGGIALGQVLSRRESAAANAGTQSSGSNPPQGGTTILPGQPGNSQQPQTPGQQPGTPQQPVIPTAQPLTPSEAPLFPPAQPETPVETESPLRLDHMEERRNGQFRLEYPVFSGKRSEELNRLVENFALGLGISGSVENSSYEADYLCEVTLVNDSIVSMVFCGTGYVPGAAHDFRDVVPLNVEIRTMQPIVLWDIFAMDMEGFSDIIYGFGQPYGAAWSVPAADFPDLLSLDLEVYHGLTRAPNGFLTPRGPVLLSYVGVTGVEWLDVLLPINMMKDYYNNDAIPWERLYTNN